MAMEWGKIDWKRIGQFCLCLVVGAFASFYGQPLIHGNELAINVIVTVFSILAGFLVGIITFMGDPAFLAPGTWRDAELSRDIVLSRLIRHKWLFRLYLITLMFIVTSLMVPKEVDWKCVQEWLERIYIFLSVLAFFISLGLPGFLLKLQQDRIDFEIERRRKEAGISNQPKIE